MLITFLLLITSFSFSQSGAAKSLEIGNKWLYQYTDIMCPYTSDCNDTTITYIFNEVINDTSIDGKKYAVLKSVHNKPIIYEDIIFQRADSNKVYRIYSDGNERVVIDFGKLPTTDGCTVDWQLSHIGIEKYFGVDRDYQIWVVCDAGAYERKTIVKGIGRYSYYRDEDTERRVFMELISMRLENIKYGAELPKMNVFPEMQYTNKNGVSFQLNNYASSLVNSVQYNINNTEWVDVLTNTAMLSIAIEEEGNYNIEFDILNVFDESYNDFATFVVDRTPPTIQLYNKLDSKIYLNNVTHNSSIEYEIVDDNFDKIRYSLNESDTAWVYQQTSSIPLINLDVENTLVIKAYDLAHNVSTKSYEIIVDSKAPEIEFSVPLESINLLVDNGNQLSLGYKVVEKYFDKIGYSINNSDWIWLDEQKSTLNITVENDDDCIQIKAVDLAGNESEIYEINVEKITDFKLTQNFPNPFNPTTQISYELPQNSKVELIIYNSLGEEVNILVNQEQAVGRYTINWNGSNLHGEQVPGGIYFYTLKTEDFKQTRKMLLLR